MDDDLLKILSCPETKEDLVLAEEELIEKINQAIEKNEITNRGGDKVTDKIDGGLVRLNDQRYLFPIRDNVPILVIEEMLLIEKFI